MQVNRSQTAFFAILLVGAGLLVLLALSAFGVLGRFSVDACIAQAATDPRGPARQPTPVPFDLPGLAWTGIVVGLCAAGFVIGGIWGHERARGHGANRERPSSGAPSTALHGLLVLLFGFGVVALAYETHAVATGSALPWWPITYFVRCAYDVVSIPTVVGALLISTLVGHWLGYEARVELSDR